MIKRLLFICLILVILLSLLVYFSIKPKPERTIYGMSFNTPYAEELGLDWQETYDAILNDLGVRHLRLSAHWTMVEKEKDNFNFVELDYQLDKAEEVGADVVFALGRRLPRWPECHVPDWAQSLTWEEQKDELREYIKVVVNRYKNRHNIIYWQVENEPYLGVFAREHCQELDEDFLKEEISLVRKLDPSRPILITDSGNLGTWWGAYKNADVFGTSVYVYFWNPELGQFKTFIPPWFYQLKEGVLRLVFGDKSTILIELSAEPWLVEPIVDVPLDTQYSRMNLDKFNNIIEYAKETRFEKQYLWGAEWWYWLKLQGEEHMWVKGKELFNQ